MKNSIEIGKEYILIECMEMLAKDLDVSISEITKRFSEGDSEEGWAFIADNDKEEVVINYSFVGNRTYNLNQAIEVESIETNEI